MAKFTSVSTYPNTGRMVEHSLYGYYYYYIPLKCEKRGKAYNAIWTAMLFQFILKN